MRLFLARHGYAHSAVGATLRVARVTMADEPKYASEAARIAAKMDPKRREQMFQVFKSLDENGDGQLQQSELIAFLNTLGYVPTNAEVEADKIFARWDSDGDGTISFDEFVASQVKPAR